MAIDLKSIAKNVGTKTPLMVLHGTPGIGKTTFCSQLPKPLFIVTDQGGLGSNEVDAFPTCKSWTDVEQAISACFELEKDTYDTLVIDSLSSLEPIILKQVSTDLGKKNIEDVRYGKGYLYALDYWNNINRACRELIDLGIFKMVVLIAHSDVVRFESPETESYDRHNIKLHKLPSKFFCEQSDIVGFASMPIFIKKIDDKKLGEKAVAKKRGDTLLYLSETPSLIAKNRYSMPESIPFDANVFMGALMGNKQTKGDN